MDSCSSSPPFRVGDEIKSMTYDHPTAQYGRVFEVIGMRYTNKGWRVKVRHPYARFNPSEYYARKFFLVNPKQEPIMAFFALNITKIDLKEKGLERRDIDPDEILIAAQDQSTVKNAVTQELAKDPTQRFAIFQMITIAEVEQPRPPVRFRDMR